jgi:hypothetical protein
MTHTNERDKGCLYDLNSNNNNNNNTLTQSIRGVKRNIYIYIE